MESMDPALEKNRPLAREIVRILLEAWRHKRSYKDRSEKRVAHRKLYLSLMRQLMHEIGQRSLHDIIMQRVTFFNQHFKTLLTIEQFQDLMYHDSKPQATTLEFESDHNLTKKDRRNSDDNDINVDKSNGSSTQSEYEVKSTDALRSIALYQYDPEQDNEEIFSNIKEIERQEGMYVDIETNDSSPSDSGVLINIRDKIEHELDCHDDRKDALEKEEDIRGTGNKDLHPNAEALRKRLEPLLVYRDDPDMYDRIIAPDIRGKKFKISNDGRCPRCHHKRNVFVILDFLFPMGDMPEICNYLIAKGQAVLWSSQDDSHCKDPPTILCRGKCDSDPAKCGFNLNWSKTDLESIFFFPKEDDQPKSLSSSRTEQTKEGTAQHSNDHTIATSLTDDGRTTKEIQEFPKVIQELPQDENGGGEDDMADFDEGLIDMKHYKSHVSWVVLDDFTEDGSGGLQTEDEMIKTMLALSSAKEDWKKGDAKLWPVDADGGQESVADTVQISGPSSGTINEQNSKQSYAFSWDSYGSNPWAAPTDSNKKKTQSSESKPVMITTGRTQVPKLPSPIQPSEAVEENRLEQSEKEEPNDAVPVTDSIDGPTADLGEPKDASTVLSSAKESRNETAPVGGEGSAPVGEEGSSGKQKPYTAEDYPVSKNGTCPYCKSADVVYIIIDYKNDDDDDDDDKEKNDEDLPEILKKLLDYHYAYKMPKDENEPPSFQCRSCTYGFNLDWSSTDLETIFREKLEQAKKEPPGNHGSDYASNVSNENDMTYNAHSYGYQVPAGSGYPALYYASPFMSFYPTMGVSPMTYPSFYPTHFMPGYFPSPHAYSGYMPHYPNMRYPTPDGVRSHPRGSPWPRIEGASKGRRRDTTDSNLCSDEATSAGKSRESIGTGTTTAIKKGSADQLDKDGENSAGKGDAAGTIVTSEMQTAISNDTTVDLKSGQEDNGRSKIEDQPAAPGVDPSEDKVVFAPKESIKEPEDNTTPGNKLLESEEIAEPAVSEVTIIAGSSSPAVESDANIGSESPVDNAISAKDSNTQEVPENEPAEKKEDVEKKRRRTEDVGATDGEKPSVEDEEDETVSMRITRRKARALGRGRGRGRGKSKGKASRKT